MFTGVCLSTGGCYPSMHCRWYPSMPCSRSPGGGIPACSAGGIPACLAAGVQEGSPGPHPRGKWRGSGPGPQPRGKLRGIWSGGLLGGVPAPGGACSRGVPGPRGVPALEGACSGGGCLVETPAPDGYCCGQYASYWNAFLFLDRSCLNDTSR